VHIVETEVNLQPDPADVEKNKVMGILAYFIFFLPLLAAKDSKFAMYHANQGLLVFLLWVAYMVANFILAFIPIIGWILMMVLWLVPVIWTILGIVNAAKGEMKPLPLVGKISIIKV
jgi:uncharacterized membrane protein